MPERFYTFRALEASMGRRAGDRGDRPIWEGHIGAPNGKNFFSLVLSKGKK